jgi:serine/threonine protein kinase
LNDWFSELDETSEPGSTQWSEAVRNVPKWTGCLVGAVLYIHKKMIWHKDIKPANILIHNDEVVIADFGIAKDFADGLDSASSGTQPERTPIYAAPEQYDDQQRRGTATDVFSLGCTFLELAAVFSHVHSVLWKAIPEKGGPCYRNNERNILVYIVYLKSFAQGRQEDVSSLDGLLSLSLLMLCPWPASRITLEEVWDLCSSNRHVLEPDFNECAVCTKSQEWHLAHAAEDFLIPTVEDPQAAFRKKDLDWFHARWTWLNPTVLHCLPRDMKVDLGMDTDSCEVSDVSPLNGILSFTKSQNLTGIKKPLPTSGRLSIISGNDCSRPEREPFKDTVELSGVTNARNADIFSSGTWTDRLSHGNQDLACRRVSGTTCQCSLRQDLAAEV